MVKSLMEDFEEEIKKFEKSFSVDKFIETDFANDLCWEVEDFEEEIRKFEKFFFVDETNCVDKSCREFNCVDDEFRELEQNFSAPDSELNPPPEHMTKGYTLSEKIQS
ncbi:hypothetical protein GQ457_06G007210 [Hibiscus cannabinus]